MRTSASIRSTNRRDASVMPTFRPGLGPAFLSSRRTRVRGQSRASHATVPSLLATSTTVIRSEGQPASAREARVAGRTARLSCATIATSTSEGKAADRPESPVVSRDSLVISDGRHEPLASAAARKAREKLSVQAHQAVSIVTRPNQPASQRALGESDRVTGLGYGSPGDVARDSPGEGDVPDGGRLQLVIQHRTSLGQFLADDRDSRRIIFEMPAAGTSHRLELRAPSWTVEKG